MIFKNRVIRGSLKQINDVGLIEIAEDNIYKEQNENLDLALLESVAYINYEKTILKDYIKKTKFSSLQMSDCRNTINILNQILVGIEDRSKSSFFGDESIAQKDFEESA